MGPDTGRPRYPRPFRRPCFHHARMAGAERRTDLMTFDIRLGEQVDALVSENQHLRIKSENDDKTLHLMREQYDALAASVEGLRAKHDREVHTLRTERDVAVRQFKTID